MNRRKRKHGSAKQMLVSDVIRRFADALDEEIHREHLAKVDPVRVKLRDMCAAVQRFGEALGIDTVNWVDKQAILSAGYKPTERMTDELRRFADVLDRDWNKARAVDPGCRRLTSLVKGMQMYAGWLGVDLGCGGPLIVGDPLLPGTF